MLFFATQSQIVAILNIAIILFDSIISVMKSIETIITRIKQQYVKLNNEQKRYFSLRFLTGYTFSVAHAG